MKKLLLLGLVVLGTACQKNYYLDDLNEANETIEQLEITIADLRIELADANEVVVMQTILLDKAKEDLDNLQAEYTYVNESQSAFIHELNAKIEGYLTTIAELEAELVELNAYTQGVLENYTHDVVSLKAQIKALQDEIDSYVPEIVEVIKEIEVIVEVEKIVTKYESVGVQAISYYDDHAIVLLSDGQMIQVDYVLPAPCNDAIFRKIGPNNAIQLKDENGNTVFSAWIVGNEEATNDELIAHAESQGYTVCV
ncbi:MAG: hypothetical protein ACR2M7_02495 [Bdellovibrionales bacterium]